MNFWEFREDHSRGYWLPVDNNTAYRQGGALVRGLFIWVILLLKLSGVILIGLYKIFIGICLSSYTLFRLLRKPGK